MAAQLPIDDHKIKHLEMIQAVIARLGNDSFLVKGWALTVAGAFFGFAIDGANPGLAWASLVPTALFWSVDVHFLRAERLFRVLFDYVRAATKTVEPFFMAATDDAFIKTVRTDEQRKNHASWWKTLRRPTLLFFYGTLIVVALIFVALIESQSPALLPQPAVTRIP